MDIRPLRLASGDAHFNEVFLDDVFVPDDMLVNEPGAGWTLAIATMANERVAIGAYVKLDKEAELRALAAQPRPDQWAVRQALGEIRAESNAIGALAVRDTLSRLAGREPGPASSVAKVAHRPVCTPRDGACPPVQRAVGVGQRCRSGSGGPEPADARRAHRRRHRRDPAQHHRDPGPRPATKLTTNGEH